MTNTPMGFELLLVRGAAGLLVVAACWLALLLAAGAVEALSAGRSRWLDRVGCPAAWRPVVLLVVGAALSVPGAARAETGWLPVPARPTEPTPDLVTDRVVEVRTGDSLWRLARDRLPAGATDAEVRAVVVQVHAANRSVIGPDPDLIHPGQRLRLPPDRAGDRS